MTGRLTPERNDGRSRSHDTGSLGISGDDHHLFDAACDRFGDVNVTSFVGANIIACRVP